MHLQQFISKAKHYYSQQAFNKVVGLVNNYTNSSLSSGFFDTIKDCLYADSITNPHRRATQTVLAKILLGYLAVLAPILPLLAAEVWNSTPDPIRKFRKNVYEVGWPSENALWINDKLIGEFNVLDHVRSNVNQTLEEARSRKQIRGALEADVTLLVRPDCDLSHLLHKHVELLPNFFNTSHVRLPAPDDPAPLSKWIHTMQTCINGDALTVKAYEAKGHKCPRCWRYASQDPESLCKRCTAACM